VLTRTALLRHAGGYRPEFEWAEDYDLWLRLLPRHRFAKVPQRLYRHRLHTGQVSQQRRLAQLRRTITAKLEYVCRRHGGIGPGTGIMVQGEGRGAEVYRSVALTHDWTLVSPCEPASVAEHMHIVVVSDLPELDRWKDQLDGSAWQWEGNIAVRSVASV
jgi:hypothetical protein